MNKIVFTLPISFSSTSNLISKKTVQLKQSSEFQGLFETTTKTQDLFKIVRTILKRFFTSTTQRTISCPRVTTKKQATNEGANSPRDLAPAFPKKLMKFLLLMPMTDRSSTFQKPSCKISLQTVRLSVLYYAGATFVSRENQNSVILLQVFEGFFHVFSYIRLTQLYLLAKIINSSLN